MWLQCNEFFGGVRWSTDFRLSPVQDPLGIPASRRSQNQSTQQSPFNDRGVAIPPEGWINYKPRSSEEKDNFIEGYGSSRSVQSCKQRSW